MPQLSIQQAFDLAVQHQRAGRLLEAEELYRQILALQPEQPLVHNALGNALQERGQFAEAITAFRRAIELKGDFAEAHNNLGGALTDIGDANGAILACNRAIELKPDFADAFNCLGIAFGEKGDFDAAIFFYRQAIALKSDFADPHANLGNLLKEMGQIDEAIPELQQALALNGNLAKAHANLGVALLANGDFERGWREYEWRWKAAGIVAFPHPFWDGSDLNGRTILLHGEQGMGDTIQFIRYLPRVIERGGRGVVAVQKPLVRLLRQLPGAERWVASGEALPKIDVQCPLMSLPRIFGTTLENIPPQPQLLHADPDAAEQWRQRMGEKSGLRVGLAWAGNPWHTNDRSRSIALSLLAPLATAGAADFYSLQKGEAAVQAASAPEGMRLIDWTSELNDFADTAALVSQLDLIISVDTAPAHLAAAMGKPVWLLLAYAADFRWLRGREDSPWYPSVRLFRQTVAGDWSGVIARLTEALKHFALAK